MVIHINRKEAERMFDELYIKIGEYLHFAQLPIHQICPIPQGGIIPGAIIAYKMNLPIVGVNQVNVNTIVVDDLVDTGETIREFREDGIIVATLFTKKWAKVKPNVTVAETDDWIEFYWEPEWRKESVEASKKNYKKPDRPVPKKVNPIYRGFTSDKFRMESREDKEES